MGQFINFSPAAAGSRFRDDYGAQASRFAFARPSSLSITLSPRLLRSFPVVQSSPAGAMGRLNHDA